MIDQETYETAKEWCRTGATWVDQQAYTTGVRHLDQAIAVFQEVGDVPWLTFARHQKLQAARARGGSEEVDRLLDDVLRGYAALDDAYGKALALAHHAEWLETNGDRAGAMARLNVAMAVAEFAREAELLAHLQVQKGDLYLADADCVQAERLFRKAEATLQELGMEQDAAASRLSAADALIRMGERAEAIALLEDVQAFFMREERFREALRALSPLARLYEEAELYEQRQRVADLIHLCGQYIINEGAANAPDRATAPYRRVRQPGG